MPSSTEFKDFVLNQICGLKNVTCRKMMGEFLLYYNGVLFGGIYDDRLLIKPTKTNIKSNLNPAIPYSGAKPMQIVEKLNDRRFLEKLIIETVKELQKKTR